MAAEVVVLVPVLGRPGRAAPLVESVAASMSEEHRVLFIASPDDREEHDAVRATGAAMLVVDWSPGPGDYARKINAGYRASDEPLLFLAADDLHFHAGWFATACAYLNHRVDVVGTNDGYNPRVLKGRHSTHSLVRRSYCDTFGTIDEPGLVLHPGYGHEFCDDEFVQTAMRRRRYAHAHDSVVEHLHPHAGKAVTDATYERGFAQREQSRLLYESRRHLWRR